MACVSSAVGGRRPCSRRHAGQSPWAVSEVKVVPHCLQRDASDMIGSCTVPADLPSRPRLMGLVYSGCHWVAKGDFAEPYRGRERIEESGGAEGERILRNAVVPTAARRQSA